jgi:hypothetical protein
MADLKLLAKKILVGIIIAAVPLVILISSLWLTRHAL